MSLIKTIKAQLGLSNTATQNFTLTAEAADGTMKLARGNAGATTQDIITVDSTGKVTFPAGSELIGVNQTWKSVTKTNGTPYTNSTGKPITLMADCTTSANNTTGTVSIAFSGGPTFVFAKGGGNAVNQLAFSGSVIIPTGATYTLTYTNATANIYELS